MRYESMDIIKVDSKKTRLISDGGCGYLEPDNSYAAFMASCNRMYLGVKCDIRFTKDRVIITSRYRDLKKLTKQKIHISLTNYEELKQIPIGSNNLCYMSTLKDFLLLCARYCKLACIELHPPIGKHELTQLFEEIRELNMIKKVKIISTDIKYLKFIRNLDFDILLELRSNNFSDHLFFDAIKYHLDITLPQMKLSKDLVDMCHESRLKIGTYNINDPINALITCELGIDYIYTIFLEEYKPN